MFKVMRRGFLAIVAAAVITGLSIGPALAAPTQNISFFAGGNGSAHWLSQQSGAVLSVPDNASYAGISVHHTSIALPPSAPSFTFTETGNLSGGAPRLVITDAVTGGTAVEYAYPQVSDGTTVNTAGQWDLMGAFGFHYNVGWNGVQDAFGSDPVGAVYVVSDAYNGGHTDTITGLTYNGVSYVPGS